MFQSSSSPVASLMLSEMLCTPNLSSAIFSSPLANAAVSILSSLSLAASSAAVISLPVSSSHSNTLGSFTSASELLSSAAEDTELVSARLLVVSFLSSSFPQAVRNTPPAIAKAAAATIMFLAIFDTPLLIDFPNNFTSSALGTSVSFSIPSRPALSQKNGMIHLNFLFSSFSRRSISSRIFLDALLSLLFTVPKETSSVSAISCKLISS